MGAHRAQPNGPDGPRASSGDALAADRQSPADARTVLNKASSRQTTDGCRNLILAIPRLVAPAIDATLDGTSKAGIAATTAASVGP